MEEVERYRRAAETALRQLDWCIDFLRRIGKGSEADVLARNQRTIRQNLLRQG